MRYQVDTSNLLQEDLHLRNKGYAEIIQLLLDHRFDINSRSQRYGSPLSTALIKNHAEEVQALLRNGKQCVEHYPHT